MTRTPNRDLKLVFFQRSQSASYIVNGALTCAKLDEIEFEQTPPYALDTAKHAG